MFVIYPCSPVPNYYPAHSRVHCTYVSTFQTILDFFQQSANFLTKCHLTFAVSCNSRPVLLFRTYSNCFGRSWPSVREIHWLFYELHNTHLSVSRDSSVGIATSYGLDSPDIESRFGEIFRTRPDRPWGLPSLLYNGYRVIPGGKAAGAWRWPPTPI